MFDDDFRTNDKGIQKLVDNQQLIEDNIKLASYEMLRRHLNDDSYTQFIKRRQYIKEKILHQGPKIRNGQVLLDSFDKVGISLPVSEQSIYTVFTN